MANATNRLIASVLLALLVAGCATATAMRTGQTGRAAQDYDRAIVEYTKVAAERARQPSCAAGSRARPAAILGRALRPRAPLQRRRAAGRGAGRTAAGRRAQPNDKNVEEALDSVRTQLRTRVAVARGGKTGLETLIERTRNLRAAGSGPSDRRQAAGVADLPRCAVARRVHRDRPLRQHQRDVRSAVPRSAGHHRPPRDHAGERAAVALGRHAQLLPRHRPALHHRHSRHRGQAAGVRGRDRPHLPAQQRGPEGNGGPAAHRHRRPPARAGHGDQHDRDQGHAGARGRGRQADRGDRQGAARGGHRRRAARGRSHAAEGIRAADRVAGIARASTARSTSISPT